MKAGSHAQAALTPHRMLPSPVNTAHVLTFHAWNLSVTNVPADDMDRFPNLRSRCQAMNNKNGLLVDGKTKHLKNNLGMHNTQIERKT